MKKRKKTNDLKDTPIIDTFKGLLLMSMGVPVGNICPYRLKSAPSCFCGFERMNVATARAAGRSLARSAAGWRMPRRTDTWVGKPT